MPLNQDYIRYHARIYKLWGWDQVRSVGKRICTGLLTSRSVAYAAQEISFMLYWSQAVEDRTLLF
jgi:hypothetical protein